MQRPYVAPGYSYSGWSPPAQSNEASNGYTCACRIYHIHVYIHVCNYAFYIAIELFREFSFQESTRVKCGLLKLDIASAVQAHAQPIMLSIL